MVKENKITVHLNKYGTVDCDECPHRSETCLCDLSDNDDPNCPLLKKEGEEE